MDKIKKFVLFLVLCVSTLGFVQAIAWADAAGSPSAPQNLAALYPMIGLCVATIASYLTRKLSAEYSFFHSGVGAIVLGAFGAITSAVTPVFQSGTVTGIALVWAAVGAVTSFFAALNPSSTADNPPAKSPSSKLPFVLLPLVLVLGVSGCGTCKLPQNVNSPGCKVLNTVVTCGVPLAEEAAMALVQGLIPAISSGTIDWNAIAHLEEKYGTDGVMCSLRDLLHLSSSPASQQGTLFGAVQDNRTDVEKNVAEIFAKRHVAFTSEK